MATYALNVFVSDKNGRGMSGQKVKAYGGSEVKTDSRGMASVLAEGSTQIYVNGIKIWSGQASQAPRTIQHRKS